MKAEFVGRISAMVEAQRGQRILTDDLQRYLDAQEGVYAGVLEELSSGRKRGHWIWFVFPQLRGLGHSPTANYYGIDNLAEAQSYLGHDILGPRLVECTQAVLALQGRSLDQIFPFPDDLKFRSCMTLFERVADPGSVFGQALSKLCDGHPDPLTLQLLENRSES